MPKRMETPGEFGRSDVTAVMSRELDRELQVLYPYLAPDDNQGIDRLHSGEYRLASFTYANHYEWICLILAITFQRILSQSLVLPKEEELPVDFRIAAKVLADSAREQTLELSLVKRPLTIHRLDEVRDIKRLRLQSPSFPQPVAIPAPQKFAFEFQMGKHSHSEKALRRALREKAAPLGPSFLLMACVFLGMQEKEIIDLFSDSHFRAAVKPHARRVELPHKSNFAADAQMLGDIMTLVVKPGIRMGLHYVTPAARYEDALTMLAGYGYCIDKESRVYYESSRNCRAEATLRTMTEVAQEEASHYFRDPKRTLHIEDVYGKRSTTEVASAYLVYDIPQITPNTYF